MGFSKQKYINQYNKDNYKIYQFRVKKEDEEMIRFLDNLENRNHFILSLLKPESLKKIYTIDEIAHLLEPVFKEYEIKDNSSSVSRIQLWIFNTVLNR